MQAQLFNTFLICTTINTHVGIQQIWMHITQAELSCDGV